MNGTKVEVERLRRAPSDGQAPTVSSARAAPGEHVPLAVGSHGEGRLRTWDRPPSANIAPVSMREDCRHYESRTYANGEMVRKCKLDLAPEAPWRCPDECPSFNRRMFDAGWQVGTIGKDLGTPVEREPEGEDVAALLDAAEDIVNAAAPDILAEFEKPKRRFGKRKKRK